MNNLWFGVVENRNDPMRLGRCQVRVMGLHSPDKTVLPTEDLPWALFMQPATSGAMNGIGHSPVGLLPGTWVCVSFMDGADGQEPIILGSIGGIPDIGVISSAVADDVITFKDQNGNAGDQIATTNANGGTNVSTSNQTTTGPTFYTGGGSDKTLPTTTPPAGTPNSGKASSGIQALIVACQEAGYTEKNAMAAILGVCGGESKWIPQVENFNYKSKERLIQIFKYFRQNPDEAPAYVNNPTELPEFIYGYQSAKGRELGNRDPGDGAKYIGRGFIQLTGRGNYERYAKLSGTSIDKNPDLLVTDIAVSAKVSVAYVKDRVSKQIQQNDPAFFEAVVKAVGWCAPDIHAIKLKYYQYFLGQNVEVPIGGKDAVPLDIVSDVGGDRSSNTIIGFSDPNGKYPLRNYLHEPDTNRLARGSIRGSCVVGKDGQRTTGIVTAFGESFDQPEAQYAASYPYNHVYESESGHVMEFDDTPQNERINLFHRTGTFIDIDSNGTQVNKIVGDSYQIIDRNGCIYIAGAANVTVDGTINIRCNNETNIEVMGNANVDLRSDAVIGVKGNASIGVGENVKLKVGGNMEALIVGDMTSTVKGNSISDVTGNMTAIVKGNSLLDLKGNVTSRVGGNYDIGVGGHLNISAASMSVTTSGEYAVDAAGKIFMNSGHNVAANAPAAPTTADIGVVHIPDQGITKAVDMPYLAVPPRNIVDDFAIGETPEEIDSKTSATMNSEFVGTISTPNNTAAAESTEVSANAVAAVPATCDLIMNTETFQNSYVLSEKSGITIGTLLECIGNCATPQDTIVTDSKGGKQYRMSKQEVVCNMKQVAVNILEKVYEVVGDPKKIIVSSSFRVSGTSVHSNLSSDHNKGRALDFQLRGFPYDYAGHYDLVCKLQKVLPYDQLILEYRDPKPGQTKRKVWIHCSFRGDANRKMAFTMLNDKTYKRDANGQPSGFYLLT